jgi:hypothetical protein
MARTGRAERTLEGLARPKPIFEEIRVRMSERIVIPKVSFDDGEITPKRFCKIASYEPAEEGGEVAALKT